MKRIRPGVGPRDPQVVVLVGATGDLSRRKLLPGLFHLSSTGFIPGCRIIGVSLNEIDAHGFRAFARAALDEFAARPVQDAQWAEFAASLDYVPISAGAEVLKAAVDKAEAELGGAAQRVHYLSVPPAAALSAVRLLDEADLVERSRIIMEKPFGIDLESAVSLNATLHKVFDESQIFRIDHFLGKEPAQNILAFRFANGLFEPIWNRNFIDHVQIDVPETLGLGARSGFYETVGAYRDMVVTHLFQILGFMAMEPPTALEPAPISEEKNKVFRSMLPLDPKDVVRGQYTGFRSETGVDPESDTETFIALKCSIDNWRWAGVPFFLRTGKRLAEGQRIISIAFREPPKSMFPVGSGVGAQGPDHLTFDLADASKMSLSFYGKRPGPGMRLDKLSLQFAMHDTGLIGDVLEAYERLILDAMRGDHTLFTTAEGIERLWEVSTPLLESPPPVRLYPPGSWGPKSVHQLVARMRGGCRLSVPGELLTRWVASAGFPNCRGQCPVAQRAQPDYSWIMPIRSRRPQKPVPVGDQTFGLWKVGARRFDLRDPYHLAVSLSWAGFLVTMIGVWLAINLVFALLYVLSPGDVANARPGSFSDVFFFSVETLATVGYGVMAPASLYGHIVSAAEIVTGTAFTAIVTGLLFVRFSRPKGKFLFADDAVVTTHNGKLTLMLRVANGRMSVMTGASIRLFVLLAEFSAEGVFLRRIHNLHVVQPHYPLLILPWTVLHPIDPSSPLHGHNAESLVAANARLFLSIEARDQALAAVVQDIKHYTPDNIRFGMHFADAVTLDAAGNATADLSRISLLEPDSTNPTLPPNSETAVGNRVRPASPAPARSPQPDPPC